jgi:hypothetical protein
MNHIGGVTIGPGKQVLHGISWGSRNFYQWALTGKEIRKYENPSFYVDYQDCKPLKKTPWFAQGLENTTLQSRN